MLSMKLFRQAKVRSALRAFCTVSKYEEGSIPDAIKEVRRNNEWLDAVRFDSQELNWTIKELDQHTAAFAYGLVERGFAPGDKLLLWVDAEHSAEVAVAQIGAVKAGVTVVAVDAKDEMHHVGDALEASGAKGLLLSPHTKQDGNHKRANLLLELMPELADYYPGQKLVIDNFPNLTNIIHTGHSTIRGTNKFKESLVYTKPHLTNMKIHGSAKSDLAMEFYSKGDLLTSLTNDELLKKAKEVWKKYLSDGEKHLPVFMTLSLQTPLGFASFLASVTNGRKVFVPSTYNMAKISKSFNFQRSDVLVCDEEVYNFEAPEHKAEEIAEHKSLFKKILVPESYANVNFTVHDN